MTQTNVQISSIIRPTTSNTGFFSSETSSNSRKIRPVPREFEGDHDMIDQSAGINDYGYKFFYGKIKNKYHRTSFRKEQRLYNGQFSLPTE